jgi:hypothetical protein
MPWGGQIGAAATLLLLAVSPACPRSIAIATPGCMSPAVDLVLVMDVSPSLVSDLQCPFPPVCTLHDDIPLICSDKTRRYTSLQDARTLVLRSLLQRRASCASGMCTVHVSARRSCPEIGACEVELPRFSITSAILWVGAHLRTS